jgi:hypothetical protein
MLRVGKNQRRFVSPNKVRMLGHTHLIGATDEDRSVCAFLWCMLVVMMQMGK